MENQDWLLIFKVCGHNKGLVTTICRGHTTHKTQETETDGLSRVSLQNIINSKLA